MPIIIAIFIWVLWATFSTGGFSQFKEINPEYPQKNKSLANLISLYYSGEGYRDRRFVESCSMYMPNWKKAEACVNSKKSCEYNAPVKTDTLGKKRGDIFSDEFEACYSEKRPLIGPVEWMHLSRSFWRFSIAGGLMWLTGGFTDKNDKSGWYEKNDWWVTPLFQWMENGE